MKTTNDFFSKGFSFILVMVVIMMANLVNTLAAQTMRNCSDIHFYNPSAPSGVYEIDPDGDGPIPILDCQCDMVTDGGGWTLVLNYNHLEGTTPALQILTNSLPLQGQVILGVDESNSIYYWGHAGINLMNTIPFDEVRFFGITTEHNRVIDFKTSHTGTISYFKTGIGSTDGIKTDYTPFLAHTAYLPEAIDHTVSDMGDYAMTSYPLWAGSAYHWYLGGEDQNCTVRWEVDNYPCSFTPSTFHQIWVRQNAFLGIRTDQKTGSVIKLTPNPFTDKTELTFKNSDFQQLSQMWVNVYDIMGKQVYPAVTENASSFTIEKGSLAPGIYICKLLDAGKVLSVSKMIIE